MVFNSISFLIYFPIVTAIYFALPHRLRWAHLLLASCLFYMAFVPKYLLILVGTIGLDYFAGIAIERTRGASRRVFLGLSLAANIGVLAFFKYFNFLDETAVEIARFLGLSYEGSLLAIILPIGLSFHTFQAMSYTIEVYRGHQPAERHLGLFALYVMFYPQLVAGPIERPQNLLHQFREHHHFDLDRLGAGLTRMLWGLFKKVVIADRLALFVDAAFASPESCPRATMIAAVYLFAIQIYCDFSGYTDVALGAAHVMGFRLMENFDRPYAAVSVTDFWRRWHMSLSTWFRDYVYFPLGGNRVPYWRWAINTMIVFVISGLWHGASWAFVIWGALHGCYLIVERFSSRWRDAMMRDFPAALRGVLGWVITFNFVCFAWIFFRAGSLEKAVTVVGRCFGSGDWAFTELREALPLALGLIVFLEIVQRFQKGRTVDAMVAAWPVPVRGLAIYGIVVATLWLGVFGGPTFIYFQF